MKGTRDIVLGRLGVSRETSKRLDVFVDVLQTWTSKINLVSRSSLEHIWTRHIEDSAQLLAFAPATARSWFDLGSGAGLPGLVIAAMASELRPTLRMTLVEADTRKSIFLQTAAQEMGVSVTVLNQRIETLTGMQADIISARALAPLAKLLDYADPLRAPNGIYLFPKGATVVSELTDAQKHWHIRHEVHRSVTDPSAVILVIQESTRVDAPGR